MAILLEYLGPVAMAMTVFLLQMLIKGNTRVAVLESQLRQSKDDIRAVRDDIENVAKKSSDNITKIFESLEEIKVRLAHLDKAK